MYIDMWFVDIKNNDTGKLHLFWAVYDVLERQESLSTAYSFEGKCTDLCAHTRTYIFLLSARISVAVFRLQELQVASFTPFCHISLPLVSPFMPRRTLLSLAVSD